MMKKKSLLWIVTLLFLLVSMGSVSAFNVSGFLSYYTLDETSGTTANNSVSSSYTGTANNARVFTSEVDGIINTGADFTQGNDWISVGTPVLGNAFSFSLWYYGSTDAGVIMGYRVDFGNWNWRFMDISSSKFRWNIRTSQGISNLLDTSSFSANTWYHVVGTYDGSTSKLYVNGVEKASATLTLTNYANTAIDIGRIAGQNTNYINARVDEVLIANRAFTADEVAELYDLQKDGFTSGQYPFPSPPPPPPPSTNFSTFVGRDAWDNSLIDNWTLTISNTENNISNVTYVVSSPVLNRYDRSYEQYNISFNGVNYPFPEQCLNQTYDPSGIYVLYEPSLDLVACYRYTNAALTTANSFLFGDDITSDFHIIGYGNKQFHTTNGTIVTDIDINTSSFYSLSARTNLYYDYLGYDRFGSSTDGVNAYTGVNISSYPDILFSQSMNSFNAKNILNEILPYYNYAVNTTNLVVGVTQETKMFNIPSSSIIELNVTTILGGSSSLVNVSIPSYCYSNDGNVTLWIEGTFLSTKNIRCDGTRQNDFLYSNSIGVTILPTKVYYQNISTVINGNNFTMFPLKFGSYTVQASSSDDYLTNYTFNVSSNVVQTITIDNFTNQNVVLNITDFVTNAPLNYTGTITNVLTPFIVTGVNGLANVRTVKNYSYDLSINPILGYATNDLEKIFVTNNSLNNNFGFTLFQNNSVFLRFFDSALNPFFQNVSITLFSNNITYNFNTNDSFLYEDDLLQGMYIITASATNFTALQQIITLNNGESQSVDFVFNDDLTNIKFTIIDNMGQLVSDATIMATYIINGSSVVHSVKTTDLSGSLLMPLDQQQLYTLTISKVGYQTFIGELIPFESEYIVNVVIDGGNILLSTIDDVLLNYNVLYNASTSNASFLFDINSASGVLNYWGYSYTLNNDDVFVNQTNPNGGNLQSTLVINTTTDPSLTVTYFFKTVNSGELSFNVTYSFLTVQPVDNLFNSSFVINNFSKGILTLAILLFFFIISVSVSSNELVGLIGLMMGVGVSMLVGALNVTIGSVVLIVTIVILIAEGRK